MTVERLRDLIVLALREHPEFRDAKPVRTLYGDRVACAVEDVDGHLWRIHILREAL